MRKSARNIWSGRSRANQKPRKMSTAALKLKRSMTTSQGSWPRKASHVLKSASGFNAGAASM
jgi:hypothetical protein